MAIVAKVIVDVPTMQTDRPFDYLVPARLESALQAGMRVWVQFGKGARKVAAWSCQSPTKATMTVN
ncbi:primosomal protein N' [Lacticaseibacillus paracasei subsp. paracasei CNCM I-2877]|nr:primosomal protein N' [Lacticaseibacillus paracasei subsp. paracasei CNCM I-2877]